MGSGAVMYNPSFINIYAFEIGSGAVMNYPSFVNI
jgi:hypothetical protein